MSTIDFGGHVHSRNLKIISLAFILFELLDMQLISGNGRLMMIPVRIGNEDLLPYVADMAFLYLFWRFWLDAKSADVRVHLRRLSELDSQVVANKGKGDAVHYAAPLMLLKQLQTDARNVYSKRLPENKTVHQVLDLVWLSDTKKYSVRLNQRGHDKKISLAWHELLGFRVKLVLWRLWKLNLSVPNGELKGQSYHDVMITWLLAFTALGIILWPALLLIIDICISLLCYLYDLLPPSDLW